MNESHAVNRPLISVVVISYEFEAYLAECLASVVAQTLQPFEIIVCDDHSTDGSWDIIRDFAEHYPELIVAHRHPRNVGHIANGQYARALVRGELISVIDGDDRWGPLKLESEWRALCADPRARVAYSNVTGIDRHGCKSVVWNDDDMRPPPRGDVFVETISRAFFSAVTSVYRNELVYTAALDSIGGLSPDIPIHVDWDLKIRLAARFTVAYSGANCVDYRTHDTNLNARTSEEQRLASMRLVVARNAPLIAARAADEQRFIRDRLAFLN